LFGGPHVANLVASQVDGTRCPVDTEANSEAQNGDDEQTENEASSREPRPPHAGDIGRGELLAIELAGLQSIPLFDIAELSKLLLGLLG
jgi:hypothetical protein